MSVIVRLYSNKKNEIKEFLKKYYEKDIEIPKDLLWESLFPNPIESADIIGVFADNKDKYKINMWVSLDEDFFINVTDYNADKIVRYLYERYPY